MNTMFELFGMALQYHFTQCQEGGAERGKPPRETSQNLAFAQE